MINNIIKSVGKNSIKPSERSQSVTKSPKKRQDSLAFTSLQHPSKTKSNMRRRFDNLYQNSLKYSHQGRVSTLENVAKSPLSIYCEDLLKSHRDSIEKTVTSIFQDQKNEEITSFYVQTDTIPDDFQAKFTVILNKAKKVKNKSPVFDLYTPLNVSKAKINKKNVSNFQFNRFFSRLRDKKKFQKTLGQSIEREKVEKKAGSQESQDKKVIISAEFKKVTSKKKKNFRFYDEPRSLTPFYTKSHGLDFSATGNFEITSYVEKTIKK